MADDTSPPSDDLPEAPTTPASSAPPPGGFDALLAILLIWIPRPYRRKVAWIALLYFIEGLPFGVAYDVWPVYFRVHGVSLTEIGLMALLFLPYTLKPAWAPLVDRLGSRQAWIAACQFGLAGVSLLFLLLDPARTDWVLWLVLLSFTVLSATQDISIDAYAVDVSTPRDVGHINGMKAAAYRVALILAGGGFLVLSDIEPIGWQGVWVVAAALFVALGFSALTTPRVHRERAGSRPAAAAGSAGSAKLWLSRAGLLALTGALAWIAHGSGWKGTWVTVLVIVGTLAVVSFLTPEMLRWVLRPEMLPILSFVVLYKIGDNTLGRMVKPFWVDRGYTATEIGTISVTLGTGLSIAGALAGGAYIQRKGIFKGLLVMGLAQLVSNFGYVAVAALPLPRASIYVASVIESFTQGLGTAAFLSFLMIICDRAHAATQYALLSAAFALSRDIGGAFTGLGVTTYGYATFFTFTACLAIPALLLLPLLRERIAEAEEERGREAAREEAAEAVRES